MSKSTKHQLYWRANLKLVAVLMAIWFLVSCGLSIFWVEPLNTIRLGGFPLGFWIAQQGCTVVFIGLVLAYAILMRRLDRKYGVEEDSNRRQP